MQHFKTSESKPRRASRCTARTQTVQFRFTTRTDRPTFVCCVQLRIAWTNNGIPKARHRMHPPISQHYTPGCCTRRTCQQAHVLSYTTLFRNIVHICLSKSLSVRRHRIWRRGFEPRKRHFFCQHIEHFFFFSFFFNFFFAAQVATLFTSLLFSPVGAIVCVELKQARSAQETRGFTYNTNKIGQKKRFFEVVLAC